MYFKLQEQVGKANVAMKTMRMCKQTDMQKAPNSNH